MKIAVIQCPGSNCDQDALHALKDDIGIHAEYVWHESTSLAGFDGVFVPGGFTFGDYLRCGAMAARSPVFQEIKRLADAGYPIIGVCNGFQILCEAGLLPGALLQNEKEKFLCRDVYLRAENRSTAFTSNVDKVLRIPIAHGEGRYICDEKTLKRIEDKNQVAFRYVNPSGNLDSDWNFNGSTSAIAGVVNERGNVLGMMPHPERATKDALGGTDGKLILAGFSGVLA